MDIKQAVIEAVSDMGYMCCSEPPEDRPDRFVTVAVGGGRVTDMVICNSLVTVTAWGLSEADANDLCVEVRDWLLQGVKGTYKVSVNSNCYRDFDIPSGQPRCTVALNMIHRL